MGEGARRQSIITGTGFPKVFYLAYTMYRQYFPLLALTGYKRVHGTHLYTDSEVYRLNTAKAEVVEVASAAQSLSSQYRRTVVEFRLRVAAWLFRYRTAFLKRISRRHQGKHSEVMRLRISMANGSQCSKMAAIEGCSNTQGSCSATSMWTKARTLFCGECAAEMKFE